MTAPAPSQGRARDRAVELLGTVRLDRRLPFIELLSANSSTVLRADEPGGGGRLRGTRTVKMNSDSNVGLHTFPQ
jgi:hypothetical protein